MPISLSNSSFLSSRTVANAQFYKPFEPLAVTEPARAAIEFIVSRVNITVNASANRGRGNSDGNDTSYTNTQVTAGNNLSITSGGSTSLIGASVAGTTVTVDVGSRFGGNLTVESLQDTSSFNERSRTSGGSLSVGTAGFGGSVSSGRTNINSNFASVNQQSGIAAGNGGFNVTVQGNTTLTGGVITSTQQAANAGLNRFQTGGNLSVTNINNSATYSANSSNFSAGFSVSQVKDANGNTVSNADGSPRTQTSPTV
jgi:filamentous hemagglutinin